MSVQLILFVCLNYVQTFKLFDFQIAQPQTPPDCLTRDRVLHLVPFLPANSLGRYQYACQMSNTNEEETQYVTLYSQEHKIPIFSAYQAEPFETDQNTVVRNLRNRPVENPRPATRGNWEENDDREEYPRNIDYHVSEGFDKGHLFPWQYATDAVQAQATMKLTNAVPQDTIFNQEQWKEAETLLKNTVLLDCQDNGHTPILFTGAVPDYFGQNDASIQELRNLQPSVMTQEMIDNTFFQVKIGFTLKSDERKGVRWDYPKEKLKWTTKKVTVPTHMWTAFICLNTANQATTNFLAYIGMNIQTGIIKWYTDNSLFQTVLQRMYRDQFTWHFGNLAPPQNMYASLGAKLHRTSGTQSLAVKYRMIFPDVLLNSKKHMDNLRNRFPKGHLPLQVTTEDDWLQQEVTSVQVLRKNIIEEKIIALFLQYNEMGGKQVDLRAITVGESSPEWKRFSQKRGREKRSVSKETTTNSSYLLVKISDTSPTSNIKPLRFTFKETYEGGEEEHVVNYEDNVLYEDGDQDGADIEATVMNTGNESKMIEKKSSTTYIDIVLSPRETSQNSSPTSTTGSARSPSTTESPKGG